MLLCRAMASFSLKRIFSWQTPQLDTTPDDVSVVSRMMFQLDTTSYLDDVSVVSRLCLGLGLGLLGWCRVNDIVMSRWYVSRCCLGVVSVMSWSCSCCLGDVPGMARWRLCHVWVVSRSCFGVAWVTSRAWGGDVSDHVSVVSPTSHD